MESECWLMSTVSFWDKVSTDKVATKIKATFGHRES